MEHGQSINELLHAIYPSDTAESLRPQILEQIESFRKRFSRKVRGFSQEDAILITYADQFSSEGMTPLQALKQFSDTYISDSISTIHILPFYPYSSDDGFSVIDYQQVNSDFGTWEDITSLKEGFELMFDLVGNHISSKSAWFEAYRKGTEPYTSFFIEVDPKTDLSEVVRPRDLPLIHAFDTSRGTSYVWTTFSGDQVDLNYAEPKVLLRMIEVLLDYVAHGASIVRLDAVQFTWKEIGTPCIHHENTHRWVQLMHAILAEAAPGVKLITETAVPHVHNISYFGNGENESQMVYNFTLPPLLLYSYVKQDCQQFVTWADSLEYISESATYFNLLACHDGVGVNAIRGILPEEEVVFLAEQMELRGGYVSYFNKPDGSKAPYELNISYINGLSALEDSKELKARRMIGAFAIAFAMMGVPGVYIHSLLGTENWKEGVDATGIKRRVNRRKFTLEAIAKILDEESSLQQLVFEGLTGLLKIRKTIPACHPDASQTVRPIDDQTFLILRESKLDGSFLLSIHTVGNERKDIPYERLIQISGKVDLALDTLEILSGEGALTDRSVTIEACSFVYLTGTADA